MSAWTPPTCDECGQQVQIGCLLADPNMSDASREALDAILVAAHRRFHAEDRALAAAQREAHVRSLTIGPLAALDASDTTNDRSTP